MNSPNRPTQSRSAKSGNDGGSPSLEEVRENLAKLCGTKTMSISEIQDQSPESCAVTEFAQAQSFLVTNFKPSELVNIVTKVFLDEDQKPRPYGEGITRTCAEWLDTLEKSGLPEHSAGVWVRLNAVGPKGSGKNGTFTDSDVVCFRNMLLECDDLTIEEQLTLFAHLKLPIVSLVSSGGRSVHAVVRVDAKSIEEYKCVAKALLFRLRVFGVDRSNANPSRMTRLPGGTRGTGGTGDGKQRLLYLNPNPTMGGIISR